MQQPPRIGPAPGRLSLWLRSVRWWHPVRGLQGAAVNARMLRTGGEYVNATNTLNIPAWTRVDLGARYGFKADDKYITLRANVENVANKAYWASASTANNYLTQGEPRTVKLSATVDF